MGGARTDALRALASKHGVSMFTVLSVCLGILLRRYTGHDDVVFTVPVARRQRLRIHELVGHLASVVPLRMRITRDPVLAELLTTTHADITDACEHAGLDRVAEAADAVHATQHSPRWLSPCCPVSTGSPPPAALPCAGPTPTPARRRPS